MPGAEGQFEHAAEPASADEHADFESLVSELKRIPRIVIHGGTDTDDRSPILSFNVDCFDPEDVCYVLESSFGIVTRSGLHCAPLTHETLGSSPEGSVRVSPSWFTTEHELERFVDAIVKICRSSSKVAA